MAMFGEMAAMVVGNEEIARRAGFSLRYLYQLRERGKGPPVVPVQVGKLTCLAITEEALAAWKAGRKDTRFTRKAQPTVAA